MGPRQVELREATLGEGSLVETLYTGISRGTERLVWEGRVPSSEYQRMRGPAQEGEFSFPVKYGYNAVGRVVEGGNAGELVFALHPHQDQFRATPDTLIGVPEGVPAERAVLAANMETALNIIWDSQVSAGDRIAVVGAGVVGALVGYLASQIPGTEVSLVDINSNRSGLAYTLGCAFATPDDVAGPCDVVIHASATSAGLATALGVAGQEARVVEASWYGDTPVDIPLGAAFHSKRLTLVSSQVGSLPHNRVPRWNHKRRLSTALELLQDSRLDVLISGQTAFSELPGEYDSIMSNPSTLCHRVVYQPT